LGYLEPGLNPHWQIVLPLTVPCSKAVTPLVLIFIACGVYFEIDHFITHAFFSSQRFGCVGRLCLLDVAIPDMHISLFDFNGMTLDIFSFMTHVLLNIIEMTCVLKDVLYKWCPGCFTFYIAYPFNLDSPVLP
jgi:hypothetical protein